MEGESGASSEDSATSSESIGDDVCVEQLDEVPEYADPVISLGLTQVGSCAIHQSRKVSCWGDLQGVVKSSTTPVVAPTFAGITSLEGGFEAACVTDRDGSVRCWGINHYGALGGGAPLYENTFDPVVAVAGANAMQVASGNHHVCLRDGSGAVSCWGQMNYPPQRLPDGITTLSTTPIAAAGITDAVDVAAGIGHACAVQADGRVWCWGSGYASSGLPMPLPDIDDAVEVAVGIDDTCILRADGTVHCSAGAGDLVRIADLDDAVAITRGYEHGCARRACGAVACWGSPASIGSTAVADATTAVDVEGLDDALVVTARGYHTCASRSNGGAACWGANENGQLGDGTLEPSITPVDVALPHT